MASECAERQQVAGMDTKCIRHLLKCLEREQDGNAALPISHGCFTYVERHFIYFESWSLTLHAVYVFSTQRASLRQDNSSLKM
jgi:hypothetical protein